MEPYWPLKKSWDRVDLGVAQPSWVLTLHKLLVHQDTDADHIFLEESIWTIQIHCKHRRIVFYTCDFFRTKMLIVTEIIEAQHSDQSWYMNPNQSYPIKTNDV